MKKRIIIFTDLDGTLLDHQTYSFEPALPALLALKERGVPLIICTSKTRAEIEKVRRALANGDPFIAENGGAVFIPEGYFPLNFLEATRTSGFHVIELGASYPQLVEVFSSIKKRLPGKLRGFFDLSLEEVAALSNFSLQDAELAKEREYDEPFLLDDLSVLKTVQQMASSAGLRITQGSRCFHLTGNNDKGIAVEVLKSIYTKACGGFVQSIGLGDSLNDLPLLEAVDFPVLVQKPGGGYDPSIRLHNLIYAPGEGPEGWRSAVLDLMERLTV